VCGRFVWSLSNEDIVIELSDALDTAGIELASFNGAFMPNQARDSAERLSNKLAALLEGEVGANISQLVVAEELSSSESAEK
jgi:hypothetical protein